MTLAHPWLLTLLAVLPILLVAWRLRRQHFQVQFPNTSGALDAGAGTTWRAAIRWIPGFLRLGALTLTIVSLARPQETKGWTTTSTDGIAIQVVFDRSGSMREPMGSDDSTSRIETARRTLTEFVLGNGSELKGRAGDMIGLVAFARFADTVSPLARVHEPLVEAVKRITPAENRAEDGTAIGDGLMLGASRLKRAEEEIARDASRNGGKAEFTIKSKVIVLMTDGQNNAGDASPYDAAKLAKEWGIRIYTIGVGAGEQVATISTPFGTQRIPRGNNVDEQMLTEIAQTTGGAYFEAGSPTALTQAYAAIDQLEKSRIDSTEHTKRNERFVPLAIAALACLLLEVLLRTFVIRRVA
ncbi:MAG: VWA domain-containing protein [Planctomycetota bacterium]|nr:VWA domain-containing protein [Planctomycetota bacterium]